MKRTIDIASLKDEEVGREFLRMQMLEEWRSVRRNVGEGEWTRGRRGLEGMLGLMDRWKSHGREVDGEMLEMRGDIIRELEVVMEKILREERGSELKEGIAIAIPPPARTKGIKSIYPRRQTRLTPSILTSRKEKMSHSADTSVSSSSADESYTSASSNSTTSIPGTTSSKSHKSSQTQNPPPPQGNRKESETLIQEAFVRGVPVTLFNTPPSPLPSILQITPPSPPPTPTQTQHTHSSQRQFSQYSQNAQDMQYTPNTPLMSRRVVSRERDADVISLRSVMTLDQKYPFTPHRHRSRDITPTPTDPFGLRKDPKRATPAIVKSTSQQSMANRFVTPSPRKRAALYDSPRWPRGGRPSPSSPSSGEKDGGKGDRTERNEVNKGDGMEKEKREREEEVDPAELIWKGIDEEYASPDGGRFNLRRKLRRKASVRTIDMVYE